MRKQPLLVYFMLLCHACASHHEPWGLKPPQPPFGLSRLWGGDLGFIVNYYRYTAVSSPCLSLLLLLFLPSFTHGACECCSFHKCVIWTDRFHGLSWFIGNDTKTLMHVFCFLFKLPFLEHWLGVFQLGYLRFRWLTTLSKLTEQAPSLCQRSFPVHSPRLSPRCLSRMPTRSPNPCRSGQPRTHGCAQPWSSGRGQRTRGPRNVTKSRKNSCMTIRKSLWNQRICGVNFTRWWLRWLSQSLGGKWTFYTYKNKQQDLKTIYRLHTFQFDRF